MIKFAYAYCLMSMLWAGYKGRSGEVTLGAICALVCAVLYVLIEEEE